jgi:hypothetical protein
MTKKSISKTEITTASGYEENTWQQFFVLAEHWQSDLKFFADELQFLKNIIDKYFIWLTDEKNVADTQHLTADLINLEKSRAYIEQKVENHLKDLASLIKHAVSQTAQNNKDEHGELQIALAVFVKDFRQMKRRIFEVTKRVMESEKDHRLLS